MTDNEIIALILEFAENIAKEVKIKKSKKFTEHAAVAIATLHLLEEEIIERKNENERKKTENDIF